MRRGAFTAALLLAGAWLAFAPAWSAEHKLTTSAGLPKNEGLLKADEVVYDTSRAITTAQGHVEIDYDRQILMADRVIYDQNADKVTATGHVTVMEPDGTVVFSDNAVLPGKRKFPITPQSA